MPDARRAAGCRVDAGAVAALVLDGRSLLPAGITLVEGTFERGDAVTILGPGGEEIARGIARYDSTELATIEGRRSDQIEELLGYDYGPVAVHRNDLILV